MKRSLALLLAAVFCTALLFGCAKPQPSAPVPGRYVLQDASGVLIPSVELGEHNRFTCSFSVLSSYLPLGTYELEEDKLVLRTSDGLYTYVFTADGERLVFQAEGSSEPQVYDGEPPIEDGAVFVLQP